MAMAGSGLLLPLVLALAGGAAQARQEVKLGACYGYFNQMGAYAVMAKVALDEGYFDDALPANTTSSQFTVSVEPVDALCSGSTASMVALPLLLGKGQQAGRIYSTASSDPVAAIAGCTCSGASKAVSSMATNYQVPMVSGSSTSPDLSNKGLHPYFARVVPPDSMQGNAFGALVREYGWTRILAVYPAEPYSLGIAAAFKLSLASSGRGVVYLEYQLTYQSLATPAEAATFDHEAWTQVARTVALESPQPRVFFSAAIQIDHIIRIFRDIGLVSDSTFWMLSEGVCGLDLLNKIGPNAAAYQAADPSDPWWDYPWMDTAQHLKGMMCFVPKSLGPKIDESRFTDFFAGMTKSKLVAAGWPADNWDDNWLNLSFFKGLIYNPLAFDAAATLILAIGSMLSRGAAVGNVRGEALRDEIRATQFDSITGTVGFDANGDRLAPYEIRSLRVNGTTNVTSLVTVGLYNAITDSISFSESPIFADGTTNAPADRPAPCEAGFEFGGTFEGCVACPAGKFSMVRDSRCVNCTAGSYASSAGMTECTDSSPGTFVAASGAVATTDCPPGSFSADPGAETCTACLPGFSQAAAGQTACDRCAKGSFLSEAGGAHCQLCPAGMTTDSLASSSSTDCQCPVGKFCLGTYPTCFCEACPEGMECPFGAKAEALSPYDPTGTPLVVKKQYYTRKEEPLSVYMCHPSLGEDKCPGGAPGTCLNNLEGLTCGTCPSGTAVKGDKCVECSTGNFAMLALLPLALLAACVGTYYFGNRQLEVNSTILLGASVVFGLLVTLMQLFATFEQLTLPWPVNIRTVFRGASILTIKPGSLSVDCLDSGSTSQYMVRFSLPYVVVAAMAVCYAGAKALEALGLLREPRTWVFPKVMNSVFQIYQAIFIALTGVAAVPFQCYSHPNGKSSLVQYPTVVCGEGDHGGIMAMAFVLILTFVLPFVGMQVWANVHIMKIRADLEKSKRHVTRFRFLMYRFRPDVWWWGTAFTLRQVLLAFAPMIEPDDPHAQSVFIIAVLTVYSALMCYFWPWKTDELNMLEAVSMVMVVVLVAAVSSFMPASQWKAGHSAMMVAILVLIGVAAFAGIVYVALRLFGRCTLDLAGNFASDEERLKSKKALVSLAGDLYALSNSVTNAKSDHLVQALMNMNSYDLRKVRGAIDSFKVSTVPGFEWQHSTLPMRLAGVPHSCSSAAKLEQTRSKSSEIAAEIARPETAQPKDNPISDTDWFAM